jgi:hypothetical protein
LNGLAGGQGSMGGPLIHQKMVDGWAKPKQVFDQMK